MSRYIFQESFPQFTPRNWLLGSRIIFLFFLLCFQAVGQNKDLRYIDPTKKLSQYILDHWTTDQGLPSNNIRRLLQSKDGFLWMGGFDGLFNFDGVHFSVYNRKNTEQFSVNSVYWLRESQDSTLFIATEGSGLLSYRNGIFQKKELENHIISGFFIESESRYWIGSRNKGLYFYNPKTKIIQHVDQPNLNQTSVYAISRDRKGNMWFGTDGKGILILNDRTFSALGKEKGLPAAGILDIFFDKQDRLWVGTTKGMFQWDGKKFDLIDELKESIVYKILEDAAGSLWIAASSGLYRKNGLTGKMEKFPYREETPVTNVLDLLLDPEGSLWIATYRNGLFRLKDGKFTNHTSLDGLSTTSVGSVCEIEKGKVLLGMNDGKIQLIERNKISMFPVQTPLPEVRVFNIRNDSKKNTWISTFNGLLKKSPAGGETFYTTQTGLPDNAVRVTYEDRAGNIWVGTRNGGVACIQSNGKIEIYNRTKGLNSNFIMSINEDRQGNILIGTNDGGLNVIRPNGEIKIYSIPQGMLNNLVFNTFSDEENITWIVTNAGISRLQNDSFFHFTSREGLPNDSPFDFITDDLGNVWLPSSSGIIKTTKKELNDFATGKIKKINWTLYNKYDGMKSEDCTGAAHSYKSSDGKIWVPTNGGAVVVDPKNILFNHLPPMVVINSLWADGEYLDIHKALTMEAKKKRLVFTFSALSLLASAKVRFKFKLEPFENEWIDAGTERMAVYTNLPPGKYTFRVIACNNDGVWNETGAVFYFDKKPFFYQTWLFYILSALLTLLSFYGFYRLRVYQIQKRKKELERQVLLKTREISEQNEELAQQRDEIGQQKKMLEKKNQSITDSIYYAKRIQDAILHPFEEIYKSIPESFIYWDPRDIVSGDFYWFVETEPRPLFENSILYPNKDNIFKGFSQSKTILAAVDCTGHGIPGAFMSMIGNDLLNEIVKEKGIYEADKILNELHIRIQRTLKQQETLNRDGMDLALCVIDKEEKTLEFAGAKNSLFMIKSGELTEIRGDKMPIGGVHKDGANGRIFSKQLIHIEEPTWFYMLTDGFQDQFGEFTQKKFSRHRLRELLLNIYQRPMDEQKDALAYTLKEWAGKEIRIDDVLIIGFKLYPS